MRNSNHCDKLHYFRDYDNLHRYDYFYLSIPLTGSQSTH
jgi:hypothetical protein